MGQMNKWLPLILLSFVSMFLSEILIWNVSQFSEILNKGILNAIVFLFIGTMLYFILMVIFADIIFRFKVNDIVSLLILGSIYGLLLEGIFANKIFEASLGPMLFQTYLFSFTFTALSWHAIIDFMLGFVFFKMILQGKFGLQCSKIKIKEIFITIIFGLYWFFFSKSSWIQNKVGEIPALIQFLVLFYPIVVFFILFLFIFKTKNNYIPDRILSWKTYPFFLFFVVLGFIKKFIVLQNQGRMMSFLFFCGVILFYVILFFLYNKTVKESIYEESFPITGSFSILKYIKIILVILITYGIFKLIIPIINPIFPILSLLVVLLFVIYALIFPIFVIFKIIIYKFK
jgi:hypothetical protein